MRIEDNIIYADEGKQLIRVDGLECGDKVFLGKTWFRGYEEDDILENYREDAISSDRRF